MISVVISGKVGRQLPESRISSPLNPKMRAPRRAPRIPMYKQVLVMRIPMSDQEMCMPVLLLIVQSSVSEVIPLGQEQSDYMFLCQFVFLATLILVQKTRIKNPSYPN